MHDAIDLFAGAGGWSVAAARLGIRETGFENWAPAIETRDAAGFETVTGDVCASDPLDDRWRTAAMLIASPPCQAFSMAGNGKGRDQLPEILDAVRDVKWEHLDGPARLTLEPLRWIVERVDAGVPFQYIAMEQVPPVMPIWRVYAETLRYLGYYSVDVGFLQAEQYGVPQTRKRAILVARRSDDAKLPAPTHSRYHARDPKRLDDGVLPWVSIAQALDWSDGFAVVSNYGTGGDPAKRGVRNGDEPSATVTSKVDRNRIEALRSDNRMNCAVRHVEKPASTILGNGTRGPHAVWVDEQSRTAKITVEQAAALQSFPADHPWRGSRSSQFTQIGNAVPPLLAQAILAALVS